MSNLVHSIIVGVGVLFVVVFLILFACDVVREARERRDRLHRRLDWRRPR